MLAASPAIASDCSWVSGQEHLVATWSDARNGYEVKIPDGHTDFCRPVGGPAKWDVSWACDGGWTGPMAHGAAQLDGADQDAILSFLGDLWYKTCANR